jgi:PHP family Zn ribbon phosphoesterase
MNTRKHIYYLTASDAQTVAQEAVGRKLNKKELDRVIEKLRDKIQWYDAIEEVILNEI